MPSKKKQKPSKMYRRVRQDVRQAYAPVFEGLGKQKDIAKEQASRDTARVGNIYDNLASTFSPLNDQFAQSAKQILAGTKGAMGGLTGEGMEPGVAGVLGAMGQNYGAMLGTGMQGTLGNIAGLQMGALANRADIETNVMNKYRDFVNDLSMQRTEAKGARAQTFLEELNRRREYRLAQKEQELRASQFDKELGFRKNQTKKANKADRREERQEQKAQNWVISQAQQEALDKKQGKWRKQMGLSELRSEIAAIREQIASGFIDPVQMPVLNARLAELQKELAAKRKRLKKKTSRYKRKLS